jgi:hypothetical protein
MTPFKIRCQISAVEDLAKKHNFVLIFEGYMGEGKDKIHFYDKPQYSPPRDFPLCSFDSWELAEQWLYGYDMAIILKMGQK